MAQDTGISLHSLILAALAERMHLLKNKRKARKLSRLALVPKAKPTC